MNSLSLIFTSSCNPFKNFDIPSGVSNIHTCQQSRWLELNEDIIFSVLEQLERSVTWKSIANQVFFRYALFRTNAHTGAAEMPQLHASRELAASLTQDLPRHQEFLCPPLTLWKQKSIFEKTISSNPSCLLYKWYDHRHASAVLFCKTDIRISAVRDKDVWWKHIA